MKTFLIANWFKLVVSVFLLSTSASAIYIATKPKQETAPSSAATQNIVNKDQEITPVTAEEKKPTKKVTAEQNVELSVEVPPVAVQVFNESQFVADLADIYYPFNETYFNYFNQVISNLDKGNLSTAKDFYATSVPILAKARKGQQVLDQKYPKLNLNASLALNDLKVALDTIYLVSVSYGSLVNTNIIYPIPRFKEHQQADVDLKTMEVNSRLQDLEDYLKLELNRPTL